MGGSQETDGSQRGEGWGVGRMGEGEWFPVNE